MCLTIPAQVRKVQGDKIFVEQSDRKIIEIWNPDPDRKVKIKSGDWVLYFNGFFQQKIEENDAHEILDMLGMMLDEQNPEVSPKFKKTIDKARHGDLKRKDIIYLLNSNGSEKEFLLSQANELRKKYIKEFICIHGIIEFSNHCQNDCFYCGLRADNSKLTRYRMDTNEIIETAKKAVKERGYKLLVLQSGEDYFYTDKMLAEIVSGIKKECRVFIFISIGERDIETYRKLKKAGASGVLIRFETSNPILFKKMHPYGKDHERRLETIKSLKGLGYFVASGSISGLPGQTVRDLADDLLTIKELKVNMISMGPFVSCDNTPLAKNKSGDIDMSLKMISVARFLMPKVRIPVVTALETLDPKRGRKRAFEAGANALMINLTPKEHRRKYKIYPGRFFEKEGSIFERYGLNLTDESYKMLEKRIREEIQ